MCIHYAKKGVTSGGHHYLRDWKVYRRVVVDLLGRRREGDLIPVTLSDCICENIALQWLLTVYHSADTICQLTSM